MPNPTTAQAAIRRRALVSPSGRAITLPPVHPNAGIEAQYRRRLINLLAEMHTSLVWWIRAQYRRDPPVMMALDASPSVELRRLMRRLGQRWLGRINAAAPKLAQYFAKSTAQRSDAALMKILRDAGMSVKFQASPAVQDVMAASVGENVALIKTIASTHFAQVEQAVLRSAALGGDLKQLTDELADGYGVTRRRAAFIARDQSSKMTAVVTRARQAEIGVTHAIWLHSGGGRHPRPSHVAFSGKRYPIAEGVILADEPNEKVWPGTAINCRCVSKSIVPGADAFPKS